MIGIGTKTNEYIPDVVRGIRAYAARIGDPARTPYDKPLADLLRSYADRIVCAWANEFGTDAWLLDTEIGGEGGAK